MSMNCLRSLLRAVANYKGTSVVHMSSSADEHQRASMQYNGTCRLPSVHFSSQSATQCFPSMQYIASHLKHNFHHEPVINNLTT